VEGALLSSDLGVRAVDRLMDRLRASIHIGDPPAAIQELKDEIYAILGPAESEPLETIIKKGPKPFVILSVGVNGVLVPLLVAADTFRAAATEQLDIWGKKIGVDVIKHRQGADPAAVVFDGIVAAKARSVDVVLIDTAGRLHTKVNLMDELKKIRRVLDREMPGAPHEILLTLDGTIGQNALAQAKQFHEAIGVTGLAITKLDGTAKGGVLVAIAEEFKIPVRLIGVGEQEEDLQVFRAREFADALLAVDV
jgi:fused signal recognition particle receptor